MKPIIVSYDDAMTYLERAVQDKGAGYIYDIKGSDGVTECLYFNNDAPACIVGHVFSYMGVQPSTFDDEDMNGAGVHGLVEKGVLVCDKRTEHLLDVAQVEQDCGVPWRDAVNTSVVDVRRTFVSAAPTFVSDPEPAIA